MNLPSVTQVLTPWADFSHVNPDVLAHAAARGTEVHRACAAMAQGLWVAPVTEEAIGYIASFQAWSRAVVQDVLLVEAELADKALGFRGHPDLICRIWGDSGLTLVDLKTPASRSPLWRVQLAAYKRLAIVNYFNVRRVMSLRLKRDGSRPIVDEYTDSAADLAGFVHALNAHRYFSKP